jgi:hypothetical protein
MKLTVKIQGRCPLHPRYNPAKDGEAGIKGGCGGCLTLFELHARAAAIVETTARTQGIEASASLKA